jgi:hypothetical protein
LIVVRGPDFISRYQVVDRLGLGGMGALYLARDPALDRLVAIKLLREDFDSRELRERFAREGRAVARLTHPNIVMIFDVGEHEGQPFIAMEYVPGETLAAKIRQREPISQSRRLQYLEDLCAGLEHAHKANIIHRDIKPANVMITPQGALKILDFGIARWGESSMTESGVMVGTLSYMSPEQMTGDSIDHRSDIFSVGAVAYELLSYQQAFPGGIKEGVLHKILASPPPPLESLGLGLDPEVIAIVNRALEKQREARYQDLATMRQELARARLRLEARAGHQHPPIAMPARDDDTVRNVMPPARTPRRGTDRELIAHRRAAAIKEQLDAAREAFDSGDFERAIAACDQVLMLDPVEAHGLELSDRARVALDERRSREWILLAQTQLQQGALTAASDLLDRALSLTMTASRPEIRQQVEVVRREIDDARRRSRALDDAFGRAQRGLEQGALDSALRAIEEVLELDPGHAQAEQIRRRTLEALEARRNEETTRARQLTEAARQRFGAGDLDGAIAMLAEVSSPHESVSRCLAELRAEAKELEKRQRAEQERHAREAAAEREAAVERLRNEQAAARARELTGAARQRFGAGDADGAIAMLAEVSSPHEIVSRCLAELRADARELEKRQRAERERRAREAVAEREAVAKREREAAEEQRRIEQEAARARELTEAAQRRFDAGDPDGAIAMLVRVRAPHQVVSRYLAELRAEAQALEKRRLAEAERILTLDEPADRVTRATMLSGSAEPRVTQRTVVSRRTLQVTAVALALVIATGVWIVNRRKPTSAIPIPAIATPVELPSKRDPSQLVATQVVPGTLMIDAVPWAEVTEIVDAQGKPQPVPTPGYTPITVEVPPGEYRVTFKDPMSPATRLATVHVTSAGRQRASVEFRRIDADEYFRNAGWKVAR